MNRKIVPLYLVIVTSFLYCLLYNVREKLSYPIWTVCSEGITPTMLLPVTPWSDSNYHFTTSIIPVSTGNQTTQADNREKDNSQSDIELHANTNAPKSFSTTQSVTSVVKENDSKKESYSNSNFSFKSTRLPASHSPPKDEDISSTEQNKPTSRVYKSKRKAYEGIKYRNTLVSNSKQYVYKHSISGEINPVLTKSDQDTKNALQEHNVKSVLEKEETKKKYKDSPIVQSSQYDESKIDLLNRQTFNEEHNKQDTASKKEQNNEIRLFLLMMKKARQAEKQYFESKSDDDDDNDKNSNNENDELYTVEDSAIHIKKHKHEKYQDVDEEGVDSIVITDSMTQTIMPDGENGNDEKNAMWEKIEKTLKEDEKKEEGEREDKKEEKEEEEKEVEKEEEKEEVEKEEVEKEEEKEEKEEEVEKEEVEKEEEKEEKEEEVEKEEVEKEEEEKEEEEKEEEEKEEEKEETKETVQASSSTNTPIVSQSNHNLWKVVFNTTTIPISVQTEIPKLMKTPVAKVASSLSSYEQSLKKSIKENKKKSKSKKSKKKSSSTKTKSSHSISRNQESLHLRPKRGALKPNEAQKILLQQNKGNIDLARALFTQFEQNITQVALCYRCRLFVGSIEKPYTTKYPFKYPLDATLGVTIIATATMDRLAFLPYILARWKGHICIAMYVRSTDIPRAVYRINKLDLPDRVRIIIYMPTSSHDIPGIYPVNKLRNIAIVNIVTTHFLVMDMDMWPSYNLYDEIIHLPLQLLSSQRSAVIVPAFFLNRDLVINNCTTILSCAKRSNEMFPKTKKELIECLKENRCTSQKLKAVTHMYIRKEWNIIPEQLHFAKMVCLQNRFQEPYLLLRYTEETPFFDERFVDYGCNKVQYIDYLRHIGYSFYILTQAFATDIAHHDSTYRKQYLTSLHHGERPLMQLACYEFMSKLDSLYKDTAKLGICYRKQRIIYSFPRFI